MSGGSYNYLCYQEGNTLLEREQDVSDMLERLEGLDYAVDVARETREVLALIRRVQDICNILTAQALVLKDVWRAVEWWDSKDDGEDEVRRAIAKWTEERKNAAQR